MKKFLKILFFAFFVILISSNCAFAGSNLKNFYAYDVHNANIRELGIAIKKEVTSYEGPDKTVPLKDVPNAYIYTNKDVNYFIRVYPANNNTHIFVVSDEEYDIRNNDVTKYLKQAGYSYKEVTDKAALKEYKYDFYILARQQKLGSFYISPDLIKPLKTGVSKLNNKLAKNSKKTSAIPYSVDSNPINLTLLDTTGYYDEASKIAVAKKEYRLKQKENKYVHAYEYVVGNNADTNATITVTSERLAALKDVTTESFVDLDRIDLIDTVGSFPPVLICTCGLSILMSVPNWIRMAKIAKEATRYSHALPENYQLRAKGRMRILVLKYKNNPRPLNFCVENNGQKYQFSF